MHVNCSWKKGNKYNSSVSNYFITMCYYVFERKKIRRSKSKWWGNKQIQLLTLAMCFFCLIPPFATHTLSVPMVSWPSLHTVLPPFPVELWLLGVLFCLSIRRHFRIHWEILIADSDLKNANNNNTWSEDSLNPYKISQILYVGKSSQSTG